MRVLVLRALGLGDLLTGVPALRAVRRAHPGAHLQLAAPAVLAPLVDGLVDELVDARPLEPLPERVARPDLAVNLHGRGPQSTALLQALQPGRLLAWGSGWRADENEVLRWCRLLREAGIPADPGDLDLAAPGPSPLPGVVLVHPGAAAAARRWPADRWRSVATGLDASGADVRVTGGPDEVDLAREVAADLPAGAVLAGRTGLADLAALVAGARLLLSADTGVAHLATALGTPSVLLFGPTSPALWGPPPDRRQHRVLWAGRSGDPLAATPDPGLLEITPEQVLALARAPSCSS